MQHRGPFVQAKTRAHSVVGAVHRKVRRKLAARDLEKAAEQIARLRAANARLLKERDHFRRRTTEHKKALKAVRTELELAKVSVDHASFKEHIATLRRSSPIGVALRAEGYGHPLRRRLLHKLHNAALASSHGVRVPTVFQVWDSPREIALDSLPDEFVLKTARGHSGKGVLPLRRVAHDRWHLISQDVEMSSAQAITLIASLKKNKPPFFAEELLRPTGDGVLPDDVKIYAFQGRVGMAFVRRTSPDPVARPRFRFMDSRGETLEVLPGNRVIDNDLPAPPAFHDLVSTAERLSAHIPLPFVRVDLYAYEDGPVFGELTPNPGGIQFFGPTVDQELGELWEHAATRIDLRLGNGSPFDISFGDQPVALPPGTRPDQAWIPEHLAIA